jgi:hypothetical protein
VFAAHGTPQQGAERWPSIDPARLTLLLWAGARQDSGWVASRAALTAAAPEGVAVQDISAWPGFAPLLGKEPKAVLVRPDGHVAALTAPEPADVRAALRRAGSSFKAMARPVRTVPAQPAPAAHEVEELAS